MLYKLLIIGIYSLQVFYSTENQGANIISYRVGEKLKWSDFKAVKFFPDATAESSTTIAYEYSEDQGKIQVKIFCLFNKQKSFVLQGKQTGYILNHEQGHFDITFMFAMKFKALLDCESRLSESKVESIYMKVIRGWDRFQEQYDLETNHSINEFEQKRWDKSIVDHLNLLINH